MPDLTELNKKIDTLTKTADRIDKSNERLDFRLRRGHRLTALVLAAVIIGGGGVIIGNRIAIASDRNHNNAKWCGIAKVLSESDQNVVDPPGTAGRKSADAWSKLYRDLGCTEG